MKKKGFTLIELLAVIIILAVIALIAAPVVLNIIEQVKIKGAESSAKGYAKAVEYEILNDTMFKGKNLDGEYDVEENVLEVVYQGTGPSEGYFILSKNEITYGEFCINGYGIKYENSIGKYAPDEVTCGSVPKHEFIEPEGVACTDIENYDDETNFKIKTVEDLVCVSNLSKSGKTFSGKTVMLLSDIDINDSNSYNDINDTTYGDINGNGTVEGIQVELTTGSGFLPIGSSSVPFSGIFEGYGFTLSNLMINRNDTDYVGLFGYVQNGLIKGINTQKFEMTGKNYVGGLVGLISYGTANEILFEGNIIGTGNNIGGLVGYGDNATITSVLVNANVTANNANIGGIVGLANSTLVNGIIETGEIKVNNDPSSGCKIGGGYAGTAYSSNLVTAGYYGYGGISYTLSNEMLNGYDEVLDTWIGGDNDSSGYYFDYDSNNKIVVKSIEKDPITFTLKGEGTEEKPYLINNYQEWKEATTKVKQDVYFRLNNDIDFSNKPYYAMGTTSNYLVATFYGGYHTVSNITINGTNNTGMFGYNNGGVIKGLNVDNITVTSGNDNIGGIAGYNRSGTIMGMNINNATIKGNNYVGGVSGYSYFSKENEIALSGNIYGTGNYVGGVVGYGDNATITSVLVNANVTANNANIGGIVGLANSTLVNGVIETGEIKVNNDPSSGCKIGGGYAGTAYSSNLVTAGYYGYGGISYTLSDEMLNGYDEVLDTWIGGDNDSSGYYFDYDSDNKIVVKSVERNPITFTLSGSGTEKSPYLINNYQQWKEATSKAGQNVYFKLNTDIDFSNKPYYSMSTIGNKFNSIFDGGFNKISNIIINGTNYTGLFGYVNGGVIKGLNVDNITVTSGNDNIGGIAGYNRSGTIMGMNINNATIKGNNYVGGVSGYSYFSKENEIALSGNIYGTGNYVGGVVGYGDNATITSVLVNANVTANNANIGGIVGLANSTLVNGVIETGEIKVNNDPSSGCKIGGGYAGTAYSSNLVTAGYYGYGGTSYTLELPTTVTYTENNNRIEVDSLSYYDSVEALDTRIGGDNDSSGYYLDYNSSGNKIIVVPSGTNPGGGNTGTTGSVEIDSNYTMTQINGTTDTTAPTCELYYVRAVSNGIQASFSCTDDSGVPTLRSLFDSTTSKSAATFDNIGTLKNGSVSGNTKTVVSTWNVNNTISQPTPGTCYYFRYGAKDAQNNFSTYVTNVCYTGFSE